MPIQLPPDNSAEPKIFNRGQIVVKTRSTMAAGAYAWVEADYLEPVSISLAVSPAVSHAAFVFRGGNVKREDKSAFEIVNYFPEELRGRFVKVEFHPEGISTPDTAQGPEADTRPTILFVGRFSNDDRTLFAGSPDESYPTDQQLTAYGFEAELDRSHIETSWVINAGEPFEIDSAIPINERNGVGLSRGGNRSLAKFSIDGTTPQRQAHAFAGRQTGGDTSELWSAYDVINYVLLRHAPKWMPLEMGQTSDGGKTVWDALNKIEMQQFSLAGRSVKSVLDQLISMQRGMGWYLEYTETGDDDGEKIELKVFTTVGEDVAVDDATLPGNKPAIKLPAYSIAERQVTISMDDLARYGTIRIVGEQLRSAFTVSFTESNLVKAWADAEEAAYKSVSGSTAAEKDRARKAEKFHHVYTTFRIPQSWDWKSGDGEGGTKQLVNPQINEADGKCEYKNAGASLSRNWGHQLLRSLPLKLATASPAAEPEYTPPFLVVKTRPTGASRDQWQFVHRMSSENQSCHVRLSETEMAIIAEMTPNHLLAKDSWAWSVSDSLANLAQAVDYRKIAATVCVKTDQRLKIKLTIPGADPERVKTLYVPGAEAWLIVPGTAVDIDDAGNLVKWNEQAWGKQVSSADQERIQFPFVRYDDKTLRQAAALAKAWYGETRATLRWGVNLIDPALKRGQYVSHVLQATPPTDPTQSAIGYPVGTVITSIVFDCRAMSTEIATTFAEMDVTIRNRHRWGQE